MHGKTLLRSRPFPAGVQLQRVHYVFLPTGGRGFHPTISCELVKTPSWDSCCDECSYEGLNCFPAWCDRMEPTAPRINSPPLTWSLLHKSQITPHLLPLVAAGDNLCSLNTTQHNSNRVSTDNYENVAIEIYCIPGYSPSIHPPQNTERSESKVLRVQTHVRF